MHVRRHRRAVAIAVIACLALTALIYILEPISRATAKELDPNVVQGKVISIITRVWRRGVMDVKSDLSGKVYTFYLGKRTAYSPYRYPAVGERVRVHYVNDRGYLKAIRVEIL